MNYTSRVNRCSTKRAVAVVLALTALFVGQATAQMVVNDPVNYGAQLQQIAKDAAEFGKNAKRWTETANHYQQQLIRLQRLNFGQAQMTDTFPPRPADYGMEDMCPGEGGIKEQLAGAFKMAMPKLDANVINEQLTVCQRMVYAENMKYNESVQMLRTLMLRNVEFKQIEAQRDSAGSRQGDLAANDNEAQRFMLRTSMELDYWQARMKAYDDYVEALKWDQSRLAKRALNGNKGKGQILGKVIQAGVLKAALSR
ncbi:hypothetical protein [Lysobacter sp. ESA13C]|uniref:hypothetical protein n=1 Tax=Lysobacter sp. ESA13C TaxID=2862676 RepID=UPI001CBC128B|nr:hypothetical protein [Lysobacter sp. ESA13C]